MAEALFRTEPVPTDAVEFSGVRIALDPPMARYSLRAREVDLLDRIVRASLPRKIGSVEDGILCLGPDEWMMRKPIDTPVPNAGGKPASIVDISERQIAISVEGQRAVEVLQGGNPLDLANFPVGDGKRTVFEGAEIIIIRESETRFVVEVWRSFAEFVWGVLVKSASEF